MPVAWRAGPDSYNPGPAPDLGRVSFHIPLPVDPGFLLALAASLRFVTSLPCFLVGRFPVPLGLSGYAPCYPFQPTVPVGLPEEVVIG